MDSKPTEQVADTNLFVASNVWIKPDGTEPTEWEAADHVPGDLRIHFSDIRTLDRRVLKAKLNKRQLEEVSAYRFFLPFGSDVESLSRAPRHTRLPS
jgi:hypothetical protein